MRNLQTKTGSARQPASKATRFRRLAFLLTSITFSSFVLTTACVTVNVNFPESAVQKATDDYVHDLYEKKEKGKTEQKAAASASWSLISSAYAGEGFHVNSPKAQELKQKMRALVPEIIAQKKNGNLGETNDGLLAVKGKNIAPLLMKKVEKLVKDENQTRKELYAEIVRSNGLEQSRLATVQKSFSRSFQSISPSGTWIQDSEGGWSQKP